MDNIEFFNRFTVTLLEKLYSSFPRRMDLDTLQIATSIMPNGIAEGEAYEFVVSADDAVRFLMAEGFIRATENQSLDGAHFYDVQLTQKGLAVLTSTPNAIEPDQTLIQKMRAIANDGIRNAAVESITGVTKALFNVAMSIAS